VGLFGDRPLLGSIWTSTKVALCVTGASLLVGTANAFLIERVRFPGKQALYLMMLAPLVIPGVILGISILAFASHIANLAFSGAAPNAVGVLALGTQQVAVPLPAPWATCTLLTSLDVTATFTFNAAGVATLPIGVPAASGLVAWLQAFALDVGQLPALPLDASNGVRIRNEY
jgi:ABC-type spermidine/putrescine transport system permease subunit I